MQTTHVCIYEKNTDNRQDALSLMMTVSVSIGSLSGLLRCISYILSGPNVLGVEALPSIVILENTSPSFDLVLPQVYNISDSFSVQQESMKLKGRMNNDTGCSSFCTDGRYIYLWQSSQLSLRKVGTGFHKSISGRVYLLNDNVETQLRILLGEKYVDEMNYSCCQSDDSVAFSEIFYKHPGCAALRPFTCSSQLFSQQSFSCLACGGQFQACYGAYGRRGSFGWISGPCETQEECPESPNTHFCTQLCENHGIHRSGAVPAVTSCGARQVPGWVSCINGRLFLRLKFLLGPHRLAIFSCDSLKLEEVVNIEFPLK